MFPVQKDLSLLPLNKSEIKNFSERGINIKVLLEFRKEFSWLIVDTERFLGMSNNYIQQLIVTQDSIEKSLSKRLIRIIEVCLHGRSTFGSDESFARWLYSTNSQFFTHKKPLDFLYGEMKDIDQINIVLGRIGHGIYSDTQM